MNMCLYIHRYIYVTAPPCKLCSSQTTYQEAHHAQSSHCHYVSALETVKYIRAFELLMGVKWFTTQEIGGQMKLQLRSGMHHWSWPQSSPKTVMSCDRMTLNFHQTRNTLHVNVSKQLLKESSIGINSLEYRMEKEADRRVERDSL